jgi:predicted transcriptional regulator
MVELCADCIGHILTFISSVKIFGYCRLLSKYVDSYLIKNVEWITEKYHIDLHYVLGPLYVKSITLRNPYDECLKYLKNVENLKLISHDGFMRRHKIFITDIGLKLLANVRILTLDCDAKIHGTCFSHMTHLHTLIINGNYLINNNTLKYLEHINTLRVNGKSDISGNGVRHLTNIKILELKDSGCTYSILPGLKKFDELILHGTVDINDDMIKNLIGIRVLRLYNCRNRVSEAGFSKLKGIETLFIVSISERDMSYKDIYKLKGIKELCVPGIKNMTGERMECLSGIEFLFIDWECRPLSFRHIIGIKVLIIETYGDITDEHLKFLSGIHTLVIKGGSAITDDGLKNLTGIHTLKASTSYNITDKGLRHLHGIKKLYLPLRTNNDITDDGLKYISYVNELSLCGENITDKGVSYLSNIQLLTLYSKKVTSGCLKYLKNIRELRLLGSHTGKLSSHLHHVKRARLVILLNSVWYRRRRNSIKF